MQNVPEHIYTPQGAEADQSPIVVASESMLSREDRWSQMGQKGGVVWLTGLSASGKSTISRNLEWQLHQEGRKVFALDGDNLRLGLCDDLGFSEKDRNENLRRAGHVALLMAEAGLIVLCAFISPYNLQRSELRTLCGQRGIPFFEVYVNTSIEVCEKRDPKGLYKRARDGKILGMTGYDSPYEPPSNPDLTLLTNETSITDAVARLRKALETAGWL
jgi:adenylyl-sulfate kinase